jgi:hypothetical protein
VGKSGAEAKERAHRGLPRHARPHPGMVRTLRGCTVPQGHPFGAWRPSVRQARLDIGRLTADG